MSPVATWRAPLATSPIDARVTLPGSKSLTNRWLLLAALAGSPTLLSGALRSRDTELMVGALRALGCAVDENADGWLVQPAELRGPAKIDCGLAGTVMRFLPPVAALTQGDVRLDGDPAARRRPLAPLTGALRALGAQVEGDALPLTVRGQGGLAGGAVALDASASSQLISALLLAAPRFDSGVTVVNTAPAQPSLPHLQMTVECLRRAGAQVDDSTPNRWSVAAGPLHLGTVDVEPDLSNAAPFLAAALVTGGSVTVPGWPESTTQAGAALPALLEAMGAAVTLDAAGLTVTGTGTVLGLEADLHEVGELVPVLVAVAALAEGPSRITGVAHLRGHETDRLAALVTELRRLGGDAEELPDGIAVRPRPLHGAVVDTYDDHRIAMAAAVLGLRVPGLFVRDVETTAKTLPRFVAMWEQMLTAAPVLP
ncbi:MAG: 3-phosphoshikimate 1-carboxyvinyltransferase [Frankiales bacterium]|nr:3-phosphoshikimate 1-carboxyvinyltransferase [Frankiales bacterium]